MPLQICSNPVCSSLWDLFRWINPDSCDSGLVFWSWMVHIPKMNGWQVLFPIPVSLKFEIKTIDSLPKAREITWVILNLIFDWESGLPSCFIAWQNCSYVMKIIIWQQKKELISSSLFYINLLINSLQSHGLQPTRLLCPRDFPARILEWVVISFSRGSSWPRDQTCISCIGR